MVLIMNKLEKFEEMAKDAQFWSHSSEDTISVGYLLHYGHSSKYDRVSSYVWNLFFLFLGLLFGVYFLPFSVLNRFPSLTNSIFSKTIYEKYRNPCVKCIDMDECIIFGSWCQRFNHYICSMCQFKKE